MSQQKQKYNATNISTRIQMNFRQTNIQTNKLKQNQYSSIKISPFVMTKHDAIINYINNGATIDGDLATNNININRDLFSRRQRKNINNHNFKSLKINKIYKKQDNNKIIEVPIFEINICNRKQRNIDPLLPNNFSPNNSQFYKTSDNPNHKNTTDFNKKQQELKMHNFLNALSILNNPSKNKNYKQIRLTKNIRFGQSTPIRTDRSFSNDNKYTSFERHRNDFNHTLNTISFNSRIEEYLHSTVNWSPERVSQDKTKISYLVDKNAATNSLNCDENKTKISDNFDDNNKKQKLDENNVKNYQKLNENIATPENNELIKLKTLKVTLETKLNGQKNQEQKIIFINDKLRSQKQRSPILRNYLPLRKTKQINLVVPKINKQTSKQKNFQYSPWQQILDGQDEKYQNIFDSTLF